METINTVLLTGATGTLGARILVDLLENTASKVYCVIRANSQPEALDRLRAAIRVYVNRDPSDVFGERVVALTGNIEKPNLGLDDNVRSVLAVDRVIHSAASVNLVALYSKLRKPNVLATENVAKLCWELQVPLVYVSTHGIQGLKAFEPGFIFRESDFDVGQEFKYFYYAKSKFDAEIIVRGYADRGLRTIIVRPGDIFGDSESGAFPLLRPGADIFYDVFKTITDLGLAVFKKDYFDISPVDYVARGIVTLMGETTCYGKTFHLTNPDRKKFYQVINYLVDYGYRIRFLDFSEYLALFRKARVIHKGNKYRSNFISLMHYYETFFSQKSLCGTFDTSNTETTLKKHGVTCAPINFDLIKTYLDYAIAQGYITHPKEQELAEYREDIGRAQKNNLFRVPSLTRI